MKQYLWNSLRLSLGVSFIYGPFFGIVWVATTLGFPFVAIFMGVIWIVFSISLLTQIVIKEITK